ncbi:MAG: T9SS type A sorting domain-containing protein [Bacteroidales bacterium]|nr:T9SS type A sorting domain-containing protein [Bacteroidales bacterium]
MTEHKPKSKGQFDVKRDYLLSLLPGKGVCKPIYQSFTSLNPGELLQNLPNPFSKKTQIWYKLDEVSNVIIKVYNYTGKLINSTSRYNEPEGTNNIDFSADGLSAGIYFYTLQINGKLCDSKKMTVIK